MLNVKQVPTTHATLHSSFLIREKASTNFIWIAQGMAVYWHMYHFHVNAWVWTFNLLDSKLTVPLSLDTVIPNQYFWSLTFD